MKFSEHLIALATAEWEFFGKQEITAYTKNPDGSMSPVFKTKGHLEKEDGYYQRVAKYWKEALREDNDGRDGIAWSAAFISYLMKKANAGTYFRYSQKHSKYIRRAIDAKKLNDTGYGFFGYRLDEYQPQVGDLVGYVREDAVGHINYDSPSDDYPSHCDLVVEKSGNTLKVIGGNVLDSVSLKHLTIDDNGFLTDTSKPWFVVLSNKIADTDRNATEAQPTGELYVCTGDGVNMRAEPFKTAGNVIGTLNKGDKVVYVNTSADAQWLQVRFGDKTGWTSINYLMRYNAEPPVADLPSDAHTELLKIVTDSGVRKIEWKDRGRAKSAYYNGMALVYGRVYCKLKKGDAFATEMAKARINDPEIDSLSQYSQQFAALGWNNDASGTDTLRHLFVLLVGLGMRESSGKHCVGLDTTMGNVKSETCEAGLFQTSYNARKFSPLLQQVYATYKANPNDGFLDVFSKDIVCSPADWRNYGEGEGVEFQKLSKANPAFAAEFTAVALRNTSLHWHPIKYHKAELKPEINNLLLKVEQYIDAHSITAL